MIEKLQGGALAGFRCRQSFLQLCQFEDGRLVEVAPAGRHRSQAGQPLLRRVGKALGQESVEFRRRGGLPFSKTSAGRALQGEGVLDQGARQRPKGTENPQRRRRFPGFRQRGAQAHPAQGFQGGRPLFAAAVQKVRRLGEGAGVEGDFRGQEPDVRPQRVLGIKCGAVLLQDNFRLIGIAGRGGRVRLQVGCRRARRHCRRQHRPGVAQWHLKNQRRPIFPKEFLPVPSIPGGGLDGGAAAPGAHRRQTGNLEGDGGAGRWLLPENIQIQPLRPFRRSQNSGRRLPQQDGHDEFVLLLGEQDLDDLALLGAPGKDRRNAGAGGEDQVDALPGVFHPEGRKGREVESEPALTGAVAGIHPLQANFRGRPGAQGERQKQQ